MGRRTPFDVIRDTLEPRLPNKADRLPRKWERLGDVLVLRFPDAFTDRERTMAAPVYADVLRARIVIEDVGGISGPLREPSTRRLFGQGSAETTVTQDGILYRLDPERVMFSSGNLDERVRMGRLDVRGERVVDLFAGIGYFTLPLAVHGRAEQVTACELNPVSVTYLRANVERNDVVDRVTVSEGDCRDVAPRGSADRVLLGYFPGGHAFLPTALDVLRPRGGWVHYHDTVHANRPEAELLGHLDQALGERSLVRTEHTVRVVKSYAPGVVHAVIDVRLIDGGGG